VHEFGVLRQMAHEAMHVPMYVRVYFRLFFRLCVSGAWGM
jgi:hypothetical protein